jgi:beta-N-acetylhexosaminidase
VWAPNVSICVTLRAHTPAQRDGRRTSVTAVRQRRRLTIALVAVVALSAATAGAIVGANQDDSEAPAGPLPERTARPLDRTSFLAKIVPAREEPRPRVEGPVVPRSVADLARRLPLERKVAQLFLFGFRGTDLNAEIFRRLRRLDLGGIVLAAPNYLGDPALLGQLGGEARVIASQERHVPPWVLAVQDGAEFNALQGLPPALAPADLASADEAAAQATETARTLRGLNVTGVLGPVLDVGFESGSALGARIYSDDPAEVSAYGEAVIGAYRQDRLFGAVKHFPGLGTADQSTELGPATVGLDLDELRERDLRPFRAAIEAGAAGVLLSHALYPVNDFTQPASLTRAIATDLLRGELGFQGVTVTDDLADPAITALYSVPDAAVQALRAGADLLFISGPAGDQQAAYAAVLRAVRRGEVPRRRLDAALLRALEAKEDYGLIR